MPSVPAPADPGWDEDPAWTRPDPMTAAELEADLDWLCEFGEPPEPEDYEDTDPLTPEELAEIRQAAADELLAVQAGSSSQPGSAGTGSGGMYHHPFGDI